MTYLVLLFFVSQLGFWLRFIVKDIFDIQQFFLSCTFLLAAVVIAFVTKRQSKRDLLFQPSEQLHWQTKLTEFTKTTPKKLTKQTETRFTYERYYNTLWQRLYVELLNAPEQYVNLTFKGFNTIRWHEQRQKLHHTKRSWILFVDDKQSSLARYNPSIKNALNFEQHLIIELPNASYKWLRYKGSNQMLLYKGSQQIGEGDLTKLFKGHYYIAIQDENEAILATAFVLFHYMYK